MEKRQYKNTEQRISLLGLGCMRLPRLYPDKQDIDYAKAQEIVDYAYESGVNYFDTAHMYHDGLSEEFVGHALKKYDRSTLHIATKMPMWMAETPADVDRIFKLQLERLQTDYIDFYLVHAMNKSVLKKMQDFKVYEYLSKKKEEGAIRRLGFSFHDTPDVLETIVNGYAWDFAQIQLNYLDWEMQDAKRQYEILAEKNIPCIIMEPVRGGALADLCEESNAVFKAADPSASIASWAIRYAATPANVLTVLSGMSNMEQVQDNVKTLTNFQPLDEKSYAVIDKAVEAYRKKVTVPCTGCRYCVEYCPVSVDIPKMFKLYNSYALSGDRGAYKSNFNKTSESERLDNCIACGACMEHCPQAIAIPDKLAEIGAKNQEIFK